MSELFSMNQLKAIACAPMADAVTIQLALHGAYLLGLQHGNEDGRLSANKEALLRDIREQANVVPFEERTFK